MAKDGANGQLEASNQAYGEAVFSADLRTLEATLHRMEQYKKGVSDAVTQGVLKDLVKVGNSSRNIQHISHAHLCAGACRVEQ